MSASALKSAATGVAPVSANPIASFSRFLDGYKPQMLAALPKHITPERMARLVLTCYSSTPKLQKCTNVSIISSIMTASQLGLEIGVNGQGYLIPYEDRRNHRFLCQFVPGWKGLVDLVNRSGRANCWTGVVHQGDVFDYELGDRPFIKHKPGDEDDPSKITHVYAVGRVNGAEWPVIEVWTIGKVWKHRNKINKVGEKHYSFEQPEMYARKIPLLQVIKYLPQSVEVANAVALSEAQDRGDLSDVIDGMVTLTQEGDDEPGVKDGRDDDGQDGGQPAADADAKKDDKPAAKKTKAAKPADAQPETHEQIVARLKRWLDEAKNGDDAAAVLDGARSEQLPEPLLEQVIAHWSAKWGGDR